MFVIMRHEDYLQFDGSFRANIESVRLISNRSLAERIAKKLNAEVISIELLLRKKVWILDSRHKFQFDRVLQHVAETVESWPEWKQNILENCGPTVAVPRLPIINGEQSDGW